MADENGGGTGDIEILLFVFGGFAILVFLWFMSGGPAKTDFRGIFLNQPAPVGDGGAYGPQIKGTTNTDTTNTNQQN